MLIPLVIYWIITCCISVGAHAIALRSYRVAIIGGGISGASLALFLKQDAMMNSLEQFSLTVDMYERNSIIGGRMRTLTWSSSAASTESFELGASIMHDSNLYMKMFAEHLNLTVAKPVRTNRQFGIFDGRSFLYRSSEGFLDALRFMWRYGLWDFLRLREAVGLVADQFAQYYHNQGASDMRDFMASHSGATSGVGGRGVVHDTPVAHDTVEGLLQSVGLFSLTQRSAERYLLDTVKLSPTSKLLTELVAAAVRVNYNQPLSTINALAGAVGIIPLSKPDLFVVREGNERIPQLLADRYVDNVHLSHTVEVVRRMASDKFILSGSTASGAAFASAYGQEYDVVVVAAPLGAASDALVLLDADGSRVALGGHSRLQYKRTVSTFVEGRLDCGYFNLSQDQCDEPLPASLLTADPGLTGSAATAAEDRIGFTSIGSYSRNEQRNTTVYKVFSHAPLTESQLGAMFSHIHRCDNASSLAGHCGFRSHELSASAPQTGPARGRGVHSKDWLAYPAFGASMQPHVPFRLAPGLYHSGAFEAAVSCMECMAVAARNVALLVARDTFRPAAAADGIEGPTARAPGTEDKIAEDSVSVEAVEVTADGGSVAVAETASEASTAGM